VRVYGPAVEAPVKVKQTTYLIVDCKDAGQGYMPYNNNDHHHGDESSPW